MVSRLELMATRNVILSVGIMLLFPLPWVISSALSLICSATVIHKSFNEEEATTGPILTQDSYLIYHCIYQFLFCYVISQKNTFLLCRSLGQAHERRRYDCSGTREPARKTNYTQRMKKMQRYSYFKTAAKNQ